LFGLEVRASPPSLFFCCMCSKMDTVIKHSQQKVF
jgi:hypothetical protein